MSSYMQSELCTDCGIPQAKKGVNRTQTRTDTKISNPSKSYVEVINNVESWSVNKSEENINRYGQDWWW